MVNSISYIHRQCVIIATSIIVMLVKLRIIEVTVYNIIVYSLNRCISEFFC